MSNLYWQPMKGGGYWAAPVIVWEIQWCSGCGCSRYASTRAMAYFVKGSEKWNERSTLARRDEDGQWRGFDNGSGEYDIPLRPVTAKPEMLCECPTKSGRVGKRDVDAFLRRDSRRRQSQTYISNAITLPDGFGGLITGTAQPDGSSPVHARRAADNSSGESGGKTSGRKRPDFRPKTAEEVAVRQAASDRERERLIRKLQQEQLEREEQENAFRRPYRPR